MTAADPAVHTGSAPKGSWIATHRPEAILIGAGGLVLLVIVKNKLSPKAAAATTAASTPATMVPAVSYTDTSSANANFETQLSALQRQIAAVAAQGSGKPAGALPIDPPSQPSPLPISHPAYPSPSAPASSGTSLPTIPNLASSVKPLGQIIAELPTAGNLGAYYVDNLGDVYTAGNAPFYGAYGSLPAAGRQGNRSFVGAAPAANGGYTLEGSDGSQYTFGPGSGEYDVWKNSPS